MPMLSTGDGVVDALIILGCFVAGALITFKANKGWGWLLIAFGVYSLLGYLGFI